MDELSASASAIDVVPVCGTPVVPRQRSATEYEECSRSAAVSEIRLSAEPRTEFGKGGARRTRRAGKIPAVIYGHGDDPRHVSLPAREFTNAVRHGGANVLLTLDFGGETQLAIPKAIQRHALKGTFDHVDLLAVRSGEKVSVDVPVVTVGEAVSGALLEHEASTVTVEAEATHLPSSIEVDVAGLPIGTQITAGRLQLPQGVSLVTDADHVIVLIAEAPTAEAVEADTERAASELGVVEDRPTAAATAESEPAGGSEA
jgi:large subunit ribosomal protein L25